MSALPLLVPASKFTKIRAAAFTSLCTRNVSALNSSIAVFQQSRSRDYPWNIEAEFSARNISPILSAMKAGRFKLGLLVNFGHYPKLQYERIATTRSKPEFDEPISFEVFASFGVFGG